MHLSKNFLVYHVTVSIYSRTIFRANTYLKDIYKTLKVLGKIQLVSELTILLNL